MEIVICSSCEGKGTITVHDERNFRCEIDCDTCNKTGRLLTTTYKYKVPFSTDKHLVYKYDNKLMELIRELEKETRKVSL